MTIYMFALCKLPGNIIEPECFMYWEDFFELNTWMYNLATKKGILDTPNKKNIELLITIEDLEHLEYLSISHRDKDLIQDFLTFAKQCIEKGYSIHYTSSRDSRLKEDYIGDRYGS